MTPQHAQLAAEQQALLQALWMRNSQQATEVLLPLAAGPAAFTRRGMACYRANGLALAQRALPAAYPVLAQLIGGDSFAALAADFWQQHPPQRGDIAQWGAALPAFVGQSPQLADLPWLADLATVEWALHQVATAADVAPDLASFVLLGTTDPATLALVPAAPLHCIASAWPVVSILQAHRTGVPSLEAVGERLRTHAPGDSALAETALVWRQGLRPVLQQAAPGEPEFIAALWRGASLSDALQASPQLDFNQWLAPAVHSARITGVRHCVS